MGTHSAGPRTSSRNRTHPQLAYSEINVNRISQIILNIYRLVTNFRKKVSRLRVTIREQSHPSLWPWQWKLAMICGWTGPNLLGLSELLEQSTYQTIIVHVNYWHLPDLQKLSCWWKCNNKIGPGMSNHVEVWWMHIVLWYWYYTSPWLYPSSQVTSQESTCSSSGYPGIWRAHHSSHFGPIISLKKHFKV